MPNTSDTKASLTASHFTRLSRLWGEKVVIRGVLAASCLCELGEHFHSIFAFSQFSVSKFIIILWRPP